MPSASPRSRGPNHPIVARPLAAFALATKSPATKGERNRPAKPLLSAAAERAAAAPSNPAEMTARSPRRSDRLPQASSVSVMPTTTAESAIPVSPTLSP